MDRRLRRRHGGVKCILLLATSWWATGCLTCEAWHSVGTEGGGFDVSKSAQDPLSGLATAICAPCILPVAVLAGAVVLDVALFPVQLGFGFYPYGDRGEPGSPTRW